MSCRAVWPHTGVQIARMQLAGLYSVSTILLLVSDFGTAVSSEDFM